MSIWQYCLKEATSCLTLKVTVSFPSQVQACEILPWINVFLVVRDIFLYLSFIIIIPIHLIDFHYFTLYCILALHQLDYS